MHARVYHGCGAAPDPSARARDSHDVMYTAPCIYRYHACTYTYMYHACAIAHGPAYKVEVRSISRIEMATLIGNSFRSAASRSCRSVPLIRGAGARFPIHRGASQISGQSGGSINWGIIAAGAGIAGVTLYTVSLLNSFNA